MRASLRDPDVRAVFLAALSDHGILKRAAATAGVSAGHAHWLRHADDDFAAACKAALAAPLDPAAPGRTRLTPARIDAFLGALAATGNLARAAEAAGASLTRLYERRRTNPEFAARWADARNTAIDRVEDALFDAALGGFTRTDADGRIVRTQQAAAMFRLLKLRRGGSGVHRTIELTPEVLEAARLRYERDLQRAAATGIARPVELTQLPPPTVTAA